MADATAVPTARPPRGPGMLHATIVVLLLVVLAAVAVSTRQDPPPSIAEFAPQAVEQITETQTDAAADPAAAGGGRGSTTTTAAVGVDEVTTTTTVPGAPPPAPPVDVPRVRRCVGDPPRQTEDPQSPPCVAYFDGDNGGATSKGVTATEIRVAYPFYGFGEDETLTYDLVSFFNRRYEMYGRKITLVKYDPTGGGFAQPIPADMQADAVKVDQELGAFASIGYVDRKGAEHHHYDELARRKIVSVNYRAQQKATEPRYTSLAPYQWNVLPGVDTMLRTFGTFLCKSLVGKPPRHAGPPISDAGTRSLGLVYQRTPDGSIPEIDILEDTLAGCGARFAKKFEDSSATPNAPQAMLDMQSAEVTSVVCLCDPGVVRNNYMLQATQQGYLPEWVLSSFIDLDLDNSQHGAPTEHAGHIIGVSFRNRLLPRQDSPWYWAVKEVAPAKDPSGGIIYAAASRYLQLSLLAAGIQLAGPNLTPETFEAGLHKARFANPGAGGPPYFQARVGFPNRRHTMYDDATMFWYDPTIPGTIDPTYPGRVCYVGGGTRAAASAWPDGEQPFYAGACR